MFNAGFGVLAVFRSGRPPPGRHLELSCCSRKTFRCILLLYDDISPYPVAPGRIILLLQDDISTYHLQDDIPTHPAIRDDISTYPDALGCHLDFTMLQDNISTSLSCCSRTTCRHIMLLRGDHTSRRSF